MDQEMSRRARTSPRPLAVWRIGIAGGVTAILCCVGPTLMALIGVVGAGTAYVWATDLYDGYAWWFRIAGLLVLTALVYSALRRRHQCSLTGVRTARTRLLAILGVALGTYAVLYAITTWLGTLA